MLQLNLICLWLVRKLLSDIIGKKVTGTGSVILNDYGNLQPTLLRHPEKIYLIREVSLIPSQLSENGPNSKATLPTTYSK